MLSNPSEHFAVWVGTWVLQKAKILTAQKSEEKQRKSLVEIFYFDDFEALCSALSSLDAADLSQAGLYRQENSYCIIIKSSEASSRGSYILREFARRILPKSVREEHIIEHWELVAENDELIKMAMGIQELKSK